MLCLARGVVQFLQEEDAELARSVLLNTPRYQTLFAQAADELMPPATVSQDCVQDVVDVLMRQVLAPCSYPPPAHPERACPRRLSRLEDQVVVLVIGVHLKVALGVRAVLSARLASCLALADLHSNALVRDASRVPLAMLKFWIVPYVVAPLFRDVLNGESPLTFSNLLVVLVVPRSG